MDRNLLKTNAKNFNFPIVLVLAIVLGVSIIWLLLVRLEGEEPSFKTEWIDASLPSIRAAENLTLTVSDKGNGLRRLWVGLLKDGKDVVLLEKHFPGSGLFSGGAVHQEQIYLLIEPRKLGISDGKAVFRVVLRDYSWRRWGNGNRTYIEKTVTIDTRPPEVDILSNAHNIAQGGAGLVIYRLSEPSPKSGVMVGDHFFPGYAGHFENKNVVMAFIALNHEQGPQTEMYVRASDLAGNRTRAGFPHYIRKRVFKKDVIHITDRFLSWKMPEFSMDDPEDADTPMVQKFLRVNRELRKKSLDTINKISAETDGVLHWEGAFLRLPRSSRKAGFADSRRYIYDGETIDHQVHQGIDLASVAHSPVPAANKGRIVFVGAIGIYGKTVVIDHGFGLLSTYSHLSGYNVKRGQIVARGEIIGRTGTTGLAGGDHLHFGMLIHDTFVNPVEWWDSAWIKNNIMTKIDAVWRIPS